MLGGLARAKIPAGNILIYRVLNDARYESPFSTTKFMASLASRWSASYSSSTTDLVYSLFEAAAAAVWER